MYPVALQCVMLEVLNAVCGSREVELCLQSFSARWQMLVRSSALLHAGLSPNPAPQILPGVPPSSGCSPRSLHVSGAGWPCRALCEQPAWDALCVPPPSFGRGNSLLSRFAFLGPGPPSRARREIVLLQGEGSSFPGTNQGFTMGMRLFIRAGFIFMEKLLWAGVVLVSQQGCCPLPGAVAAAAGTRDQSWLSAATNAPHGDLKNFLLNRH